MNDFNLVLYFENLVQKMNMFEVMNLKLLENYSEIKLRNFLWIEMVNCLLFDNNDNKLVQYSEYLRYKSDVNLDFLKVYSKLFFEILDMRNFIYKKFPNSPEIQYIFSEFDNEVIEDMTDFCTKIKENEIWI